MNRATVFPERHPLAGLARKRCHIEHGTGVGSPPVAACAGCWEQVIRADERVVVEFDLPRAAVADPAYVDAVALERALAGVGVHLTKAERVVAVEILARDGWAPTAIAARLRTSRAAIMRAFDALRPARPASRLRGRSLAIPEPPAAVA